MNIDPIIVLAAKFDLLTAQMDSESFRNLVINRKAAPNVMSFYEAANIVLNDLKSLNPGERDAGATKATYSLIDILQGMGQAPSADKMLSAVKSAQAEIKSKAPNDPDKNKNVQYLFVLTNFIISKYFRPQQKTEQVEQKEPAEFKSVQEKPENATSFLQRIYKVLYQGTNLTGKDQDLWNKYKALYSRRLNGLNAMSSRTKAQEQEKSVIQFVLERFPRSFY